MARQARCPFCRKPVVVGISVSLPSNGAGGIVPIEVGFGRLERKAHGHCYALWTESVYNVASEPAWIAEGTD